MAVLWTPAILRLGTENLELHSMVNLSPISRGRSRCAPYYRPGGQ
jgi:hypothetical protein